MKPNRNPSPRRAGNAALGSHRPAALAGGGGDSTMRSTECLRYARLYGAAASMNLQARSTPGAGAHYSATLERLAIENATAAAHYAHAYLAWLDGAAPQEPAR